MATQHLQPEIQLPRLPSSPDSAPLAMHPAELLRLAIQQGAGIDQLQKLMDLEIRWREHEARCAGFAAVNEFKKNPPAIVKNATAQIQSERGSYSYNYATLDKVCDAVIQCLAERDLSHRWTVKQSMHWIEVTCIIRHRLGYAEETTLGAAPDHTGGKNSIQAVGSTVSYLQRYSLLAALGMAAKGVDTDGHIRQAASSTSSSSASEDVAGAGISRDRLAEMTGEISRASSFEQLDKAFRYAYAEASTAGDQGAQSAYIAAKNRRRGELRTNGGRFTNSH